MRTPGSLALLFCAVLSCGCATSVRHSQAPEQRAEVEDARETQEKERQVHVALIRDMVDRGQYYAALAHIEDEERGGNASDEIHLLEADTRRHLHQSVAARALYQALTVGKLAGKAYHGLGLMDAESGRLQQGIGEMRRASELDPTDVQTRNDLGFALMQSGNLNAAMPELSTAAELAPDQLLSRKNLFILMILMGNEAAASQIAQRSGFDVTTLTRLRGDAQRIQTDRKARGTDTHG
jgi:Flp pilus assembly protein TadD